MNGRFGLQLTSGTSQKLTHSTEIQKIMNIQIFTSLRLLRSAKCFGNWILFTVGNVDRYIDRWPIYHRHMTDIRSRCVDEISPDTRPMVYLSVDRMSVDTRPTVDNLSIDSRSTVGRQAVDCRATVDRLSTAIAMECRRRLVKIWILMIVCISV